VVRKQRVAIARALRQFPTITGFQQSKIKGYRIVDFKVGIQGRELPANGTANITGFQQSKFEGYRIVDFVTSINNNIGFRVCK
jgi:hypothetical protein